MTRHSQPQGPPETPGVLRAHTPRGQPPWVGKNVESNIRLLTTKAVAEMLSVPEGTVRYWRKTGVGPPWVKLEGSIRYDLADVLKYIERSRRTPSVRAYMEDHDGSL